MAPTVAPEPARFAVFDPVHALIELGIICRRLGVAREITNQVIAWYGRRWKELEQSARDGIEPRLGNYVIGKLRCASGDADAVERARVRIEDSAGLSGEIAVTHSVAGYVRASLGGGPVAVLLEIRHEEEAVFPVEEFRDFDGAAQCEAVLIATKRIL